MYNITIKATTKKEILKNISDKSKCNPKTCSSTSQKASKRTQRNENQNQRKTKNKTAYLTFQKLH